jgi:hypothetical protein
MHSCVGLDLRKRDALTQATHSSYLLVSSSVIPSWITHTFQSYANDYKCFKNITTLSVDPQALLNFTLANGLWRYKGKLFTRSSCNLRLQLLNTIWQNIFSGLVYGVLCHIATQFHQKQTVSTVDYLHGYFLYVGYGQLIVQFNQIAKCWQHWLKLLDRKLIVEINS